MGAQGEALAAKLQDVANQLTQTIEHCPDESWRKTTAAEGWTVAATAHHIAGGCEPTTDCVTSVASGQGFPPITLEMLHAPNAAHANEFANCSKQEALDLLRQGSAKATAMLRGLSDEQLAVATHVPFMGGSTTAAQVGEAIAIGHMAQHLASIQATI